MSAQETPGPLATDAAAQSSTGDDAADRHFVTALARGLEVLRCFESAEERLGNQQLAERCKLPKSTVTRLTYTLTKLGYLHHDRDASRYRLGMAALGIGGSTLARLDIKKKGQPIMQALADATGLQVALGVRDRLAMVYIESCRGSSILTLRLDVGSKIPIGTTAMGRACLAALPAPVRREIEHKLATRDPDNWPVVQAGIQRAISDLARHGCCASFSEWKREVHGIAVPFALGQGVPELVLSAAGPAQSLSAEAYMTEVRPQLIAAVHAVRHKLGA
jgi:DNA-binding IclR family transcriptional regulator